MNSFARLLLMMTPLLVLQGCSKAGSDVETATNSAPPASGQIVLDSCLGLSGVNEKCTLVTNASACTGAKCSRLVVIFSGGEMGCISGSGYKTALDTFASKGYAAVCINYFDTSTGSGNVPYIDEASRIDLAVKEATSGSWATSYWTGEYLLLEGISHGATAPVILMARTSLATQAHWKGTRVTAGCFFDGSYDQVATATLLATGASGGGPCVVPVSYNRGLERYCGAGANASNCNLSLKPKAQQDTVASVAVNFAVKNFRMFECGSAMPVCSGDIIPGAPVQTLCNNINSTSGYTCSFKSLPNDGHLTCHGNEFDQCRTWFEGISP
ncbi:MAG: hypothetical protein KA715_02430 [Xanthomonadaceae bacterium]|nr:hypothetical protein [Xanthomonadaceae bacterium]